MESRHATLVPGEREAFDVHIGMGINQVNEELLDGLVLFSSELGLEIILHLLLPLLVFAILFILLRIGVVSVLEIIGRGELLLAVRHVLLFDMTRNALGADLGWWGILGLGLGFLGLGGLGVLDLGLGLGWRPWLGLGRWSAGCHQLLIVLAKVLANVIVDCQGALVLYLDLRRRIDLFEVVIGGA